jgi:hypothetical protein
MQLHVQHHGALGLGVMTGAEEHVLDQLSLNAINMLATVVLQSEIDRDNLCVPFRADRADTKAARALPPGTKWVCGRSTFKRRGGLLQ